VTSQAPAAVRGPDQAVAGRLSRWLRQLGRRAHEGPFWQVQLGVVAVTALHWGVEASGLLERHDGPLAPLAHLPVVLYLLPVVYAGLRYGFEGGLLTGASIAVAATPNQFLWHRQDFEWVGELVLISFVVGVGAVITIPVERERRERVKVETARHRATVVGHRLRMMNDVTSLLVQSADIGGALNQVLDRIVAMMDLDAAAVVTWTGAGDSPTVEACHSPRPDEVARLRASLQAIDVEHPGDLAGEYRAGFRLDQGHAGVLVVWGDRHLVLGERQLLDAIAAQVGVALDNVRLHQAEQQALHARLRATTRAQEEERRRIARDLHDVATHELLLIRRDLEATAPGATTGQPAVTDRFERARDRISDVIDTLRRFSRDLRPSVLDPLGLAPAVEWLAAQADARADAVVDVEISGRPRRLGSEAELALYRIAEEALRNVVEHAQASRVDVLVEFATDHLHVSVTDDGCGFARLAQPSGALVVGDGLGIPGMHERAALIGARLQLTTTIGAGTRIDVELDHAAATGAAQALRQST